MTGPARVPELVGVDAARFAAEVEPHYRPVVMRGIAADWPAVAAGRAGPRATADYLLRFDGGGPLDLLAGDSSIGGRFFYRPDMAGFNFQRARIGLPLLLERLLREADAPAPPALYAGSAPAPEHFPGWTQENRLPLPAAEATARVWIGNSSRVSAHYDVSSNVAVVAAGRRRFSLFPPEAGGDLYVGPLDTTLAGQPTSMVDIEAPDLDRFPRFARARERMMVADLEPGDAIYIPSLWWHEVRAQGPLNVLVNYWHGQDPAWSPFPALVHALAAVRDLPSGERAAVREWFDRYVFAEDAAHAADHLPPHARGVLGPPGPERSAAIRDYLQRALERG